MRLEKLREEREIRATARSGAASSYVRQAPDYIAAPDLRFSKWKALSAGLAQVEPKLTKYLDGKQQEHVEQVTAEGSELAMKANMVSWKEFVAANPEYTGANPHLIRGYKAARLKSKGMEYYNQLMDEYQKSGVVNQEDPQALTNFMGEFDKKWREENLSEFDDIDVAKEFNPMAERSKSLLSSRHVQLRWGENLKKAEQELGSLIGNRIDTLLHDPAVNWTEEGTRSMSLTSLGQAIMQDVQEQIASGLPASEVNKLVVNAVVSKAKQLEDEDVLDVLDHIDTGNGILGKTQYATALREATEREIEAGQRDDIKWEAWLKDKQQEDAKEQLSRKAGRLLLENPQLTVKDLVEQTGADTMHIPLLRSLRDNVMSGLAYKFVDTAESQMNTVRMRLKIMSGRASSTDIIAGVNKDYGLEKALSLIDDMEQRERYHTQLQGDVAGAAKSRIFRAIAGKGMDDLLPGDGDTIDPGTAAGIEAISHFDMLLTAYIEEYQDKHGKMPSYALLTKEAYAIQADIMNNLDRYGNGSIRAPETLDQNMPGASEYARSLASGEFNWQDTPVVDSPVKFNAAYKQWRTDGSGPLADWAGRLGLEGDDAVRFVARQAELHGYKPVLKSAEEEAAPVVAPVAEDVAAEIPDDGEVHDFQSFNDLAAYIASATGRNMRDALMERGQMAREALRYNMVGQYEQYDDYDWSWLTDYFSDPNALAALLGIRTVKMKQDE